MSNEYVWRSFNRKTGKASSLNFSEAVMRLLKHEAFCLEYRGKGGGLVSILAKLGAPKVKQIKAFALNNELKRVKKRTTDIESSRRNRSIVTKNSVIIPLVEIYSKHKGVKERNVRSYQLARFLAEKTKDMGKAEKTEDMAKKEVCNFLKDVGYDGEKNYGQAWWKSVLTALKKNNMR